MIRRETLQPYLTLGSVLALIGGLAAGPSTSQADEPAVARYTTLRALPSEAQRDLLGGSVTVTFPPEVTRIGEAVRAVLDPAGYRLAEEAVIGEAGSGLLGLPLPEAHRALGPMPRRLALATLAGPAFVLVEDPVHRQVAFERCLPGPDGR